MFDDMRDDWDKERFNEIKQIIKDFHTIWYQNWPDNPDLCLKLHRVCERLFNFAGIDSTLCKNNPNEMTPEMFKIMTGAKE